MDTQNPNANVTPVATPTQAPVSAVPSPAPGVSDEIDIEYFAKMKLRVARIEAAEPVPKSKKLLKLQVDVGPSIGKRQILAGIAQYHSPESLVGRKIVVVANLKPATLMGQQSQGMLLAAISPDKTQLALLQPASDLVEGSEIS